MIELSQTSDNKLKQTVKEPNLVLEIEGVPFLFGAKFIKAEVKIGDEDLEIGDPEANPLAFYIGELRKIVNQKDLITLDGTSTRITQNLSPDKAEGSSVSSMTVKLIDDGFMTRVITPGDIIDDILAVKCVVYMAPDAESSYPEDYGLIFRGIVNDVKSEPGSVMLTITSPESKKRTTLCRKVETKLNGAITNSQTTITLDSTNNIFERVTGPAGGYDAGFKSYVLIDEELIEFTAVSGNTITGCVRGQLGTLAASHDDNANVSTFYRLTDDAMNLALKLMASGQQGAWVSDLAVTSFGEVEGVVTGNAVYFANVDLATRYGVSVGDYLTVSDATEMANNFSNREIVAVTKSDSGSYVIVAGAALTFEIPTNAIAAFRSKYDVWPDGMRMGGDEIDVARHLELRTLFLSSADLDFYLKEEIEGREFLEQQIYLPTNCFSIPRAGRASVGYNIGPVPGQEIQVLNETNVTRPERTRLQRSISKNFYNEIIYKYDEAVLENKFLSGFITIAADSKTQIKAGNKALIIEAKGMRETLNADNIALRSSLRKLNRYKFGAETISLETLFESGFKVEIGDIVTYEGGYNNLPDIKSGTQGMATRLFEVQNKDIDLKTGSIKLELVDTNFSLTSRYALISPASEIVGASSTTVFQIDVSQVSKWSRFTNTSVRVRSADFTSVDDSVIQLVTGTGQVTVSPALSFTPTAGMILELTPYSDADTTEEIKLRYGFMCAMPTFGDGTEPYVML
jgi:hypothetical protein